MALYYASSEFGPASVVVVGMPLDRTSSYIPGTRLGPQAARLGTDNLESFSPYQSRDVASIPVHDAGDLEFTFETPDAPLRRIAETTRHHYDAGKRQLAIGGEHTITPAITAELSRLHPDLRVIQFDAHSDLRDDYLGERWCHATAMARVLDSIPRDRLLQLGIRAFGRREEMDLTTVYPFDVLSPVEDILTRVGASPVYLTVDVDVLDPGVMPDVQTPEPGGCSYRELVRALAGLSRLNVIGADIVEFCPRGSYPSPGASVVAELVRELALVLGNQKKEVDR